MPNADMSPPMFWKNSSIFTLKDEETDEESKAADAADDPDGQVETIFLTIRRSKGVVPICYRVIKHLIITPDLTPITESLTM